MTTYIDPDLVTEAKTNPAAMERLTAIMMPILRGLTGYNPALLGAAWDGMRHAVMKFDVGQGFAFVTYSTRRIRGAILDYKRQDSKVSRYPLGRYQEASKLAKEADIPIEEAAVRLWGDRGRDKALKLLRDSISALKIGFADPLYPYDSSRNKDIFENGESRYLYVLGIPDKGGFKDMEDREEIRSLLRWLDKRKRRVVCLYYLDGLTLKEAGEHVGISEGRASQILSEAMRTIKASVGC